MLTRLSKRDRIYGLLLLFVGFGTVVDFIVWPAVMPSMTLSDLVQIVGIVVLCQLWQNADAVELDFDRSSGSKIATLLLPPLGIGMHLFQTRKWQIAIPIFLLFWGGTFMSSLAAAFITVAIMDPTTFSFD
tara:strand:- start:702 stop:1094 length:393 start_codon:yes stop_codon:yes gene_type:complete